MQYLKVFKYLVQYLVFKYRLNTAKNEVFHKAFKYSGQSICTNTEYGSAQHEESIFARTIYGPFSGTTRVTGARRQLLDFVVQGKINRGRHQPAGWAPLHPD